MSWSKWAFTPKFNYATGNYEGFWQESEIKYFVDTIKGSDSNTGTASLPFKTLGKVKSLGTGIWENGLIIMVNGMLNETCDINKAVRIIGTGGDNGRCVFDGNGALYIKNPIPGVIFDNIKTINYNTNVFFYSMYASNCIFNSGGFVNGQAYYFNFVSLYGSLYGNEGTSPIYGRNNTLINMTSATPSSLSSGTNVFCNNIAAAQGANQLFNTNARYFTDNTETTPAQLLIDPANGNFNFKKDVYIWDKTAKAYITKNPLFEMGTFNPVTQKKNHIGSG